MTIIDESSDGMVEDAFDAAPKIHSGMNIMEHGSFSIYVGLDAMKVYNYLRGTYTLHQEGRDPPLTRKCRRGRGSEGQKAMGCRRVRIPRGLHQQEGDGMDL